MQQLASQNAPHPSVVVPHFVFGGLAFFLLMLFICLFPESFTGHYFTPKLLAFTHLAVLGWISMIILGALYQLVPVVMEVKLYSEILAKITFVLLAMGAFLLAVSFWNFWVGTWLHIAGTLVLVAVLLFGLNIGISSARSNKSSIERDFIVTSVIWLVFTVIVGFALAINLTTGFIPRPHLELLKLHAHAGFAGWFLLLIIGVGSRLLPMFLVAHQLNRKKLNYAYYLINAGLILAVIALYFGWSVFTLMAAFLVIIGIVFFLSFLAEAFRKRVKRKLDTGMKQSAVSFILMVVAVIFYFVIAFRGEESLALTLAYGTTILIGFFSGLILGQTYKTLPFIIWLKTYRNRAGKGKIPFPKDLYNEQAAMLQLWSYTTGFVVFTAGVLTATPNIILVGGLLLCFAAMLFNFNIFKIVTHKPKAL